MSTRKTLLLLICFIAFISLGLPDGLLGVAWPSMHLDYKVPLEYLGLLLIPFTMGFLLLSFSSGRLMARFSLGVLLSASCALTGLSLLGFAFGSQWEVLMVMAFLLGAGGGAIDASINTFAAHNFSTSTLNWLHAFYGVGATLGPVIMTAFLVNHLQWFSGYITVGSVQLFLAVVFLLTLGLWRTQTEQQTPLINAKVSDSLRLPVTWWSLLVFFLYTGIEVSIGQWLFTVLTQGRNTSAAEAGFWTSAYWGSLTIGRIFFGILLTRVSVNKVLVGSFAGVLVGAILMAWNLSDVVTLSGISLAGFALAPVFPSLIALTPKRVGGAHTANVVGFQIAAAMSGGALLPGFAGLMIDAFGIEAIPIIHMAEAALLLFSYLWLATRFRVQA